ncbi:MAG: T9SS type A sorting domain-containing protein [bacterium]|nr:T9SS type A sorting domain-containing protein [bacterium]
MKRMSIFAVLAIAMCAIAVTGPTVNEEMFTRSPLARNGAPATDEINVDTLATFNFEDGMQGWTVANLTDVPSLWHRDTRRAYGGTGLSWYCGDTVAWANGGYDNHVLMYLTSPTVNLSAATQPQLTFRVNIACEDPAGATAPYTGWDGGNVWYSIDNGTTWTPMPITSAGGATGYLYNVTSSYAFGSEFGMGPNIPEWGGSSNGWQQVTFPIPQAMRVANFKLRFAFCSDPAYCTSDNPALFGMHVDDVVIQDRSTILLRDNALDLTSIPSDLIPMSGNVVSQANWARAQSAALGHTVPWCMWMREDTLEFRSAIVSPKIFLAPNYTYWWQYNVYCNFIDAESDSTNTLEDYYRVEIKADHPDSGWTYQHHDYNRPTAGGNEWFTYVPGTPFTTSAGPNVQMDLSPWIGDSVQIRITAIGDNDNHQGTGTGLFIDDVTFLRTNQPTNDLATARLSVPYPTTVGYMTKGTVEVSNPGRSDQTTSILRWRRNGFVRSIVLGNLPSGADTTVLLKTGTTGDSALGWRPASAGGVIVDAYTILQGDENTANDTTDFYNSTLDRVDTVNVRPAGTYELGYDSRVIQYLYSFDVGAGPVVRFKLSADTLSTGVITDPIPVGNGGFRISQIIAQWNGNVPAGENAPIRLRIFADNNGALGQQLLQQDITVTNANTLPNWHTITLTQPVTIATGSSFFVWFERTNAAAAYPSIIGHDNLGVFYTGHNYSYNGTALTTSTGAYRIHAVVTPVTSVPNVGDNTLPKQFELYSAYPNPFNPETNVRFAVPFTSNVKVAVYNTNGQLVANLVDGPVVAGVHNAAFNGSRLSSGVYLVKMSAGNFNATTKIALVK